MAKTAPPDYAHVAPNMRIAYRQVKAMQSAAPGVLWLGGFKADMEGTKAEALDVWARAAGRNFLRFDYFGHGASDGDFDSGVISRWRDDALVMLDQLTRGPQILVGSSMGAWIAALAALARPDRVAGLVAIAPALDFTEELIWKRLSPALRAQMIDQGYVEKPSEYDDAPYRFSLALIEDGRACRLLHKSIPIHRPVRVLQGMADADVPWRHAMRFVEQLESDDILSILIKDGDHRLSRPQDISRLIETIETIG